MYAIFRLLLDDNYSLVPDEAIGLYVDTFTYSNFRQILLVAVIKIIKYIGTIINSLYTRLDH